MAGRITRSQNRTQAIMRTALTVLTCLLLAPAFAQTPSGKGTLSGTFLTGLTPTSKKVPQPVKVFFEASANGKSGRYPAAVVKDASGKGFRYTCTAKGIPADVILTGVQLRIVGPDKKESTCPPLNFDGRALVLSSATASVLMDGKQRTASTALRLPDTKKLVSCPTGMGSVSGLQFDWNRVK